MPLIHQNISRKMLWHGKQDNKPLLEFVRMKNDDPPRILIISGPPYSGKTVLAKIVCSYMAKHQFEMNVSELEREIGWPPTIQNVVLCIRPESECDISVLCRSCMAVLKKEKKFRRLYRGDFYAFGGNQCIIDVTSNFPLPVNDKQITVFNIQKSTHEPVKYAPPIFEKDARLEKGSLYNCFRSWLNGLDQSCRQAITFILASKTSELLSDCPEDIVRILVMEIIRESYNLYWGHNIRLGQIRL